jgi:predicted alpha/beta hydrolase
MVPVALQVAGYFPGKKLRTVGDLPRGVAAQWRRWCLSPAYLGAESAAVRAQLAQVTTPITALSMEDDEMMTFAGTRALFGLYEGARVDYRRVRPADHGVRHIGHFGFFRPKAGASLWPLAERWVDESLGGEAPAAAA